MAALKPRFPPRTISMNRSALGLANAAAALRPSSLLLEGRSIRVPAGGPASTLNIFPPISFAAIEALHPGVGVRVPSTNDQLALGQRRAVISDSEWEAEFSATGAHTQSASLSSGTRGKGCQASRVDPELTPCTWNRADSH